MKLTAVKCPNCGADLEYEEGMKTIYCKYCGTPVIIDDESVKIDITNRIVDEAEVERVKLKRTQYEHEHERAMEEAKDFLTREKEWKQLFLEYLAAVAVTLFISMIFANSSIAILETVSTALFGVVLIIGGIGIYVLKPKKNETPDRYANTIRVNISSSGYTGYRSPKSKTIAFAWCLFFGYFGAHYFYVKKTTMGIIYLFTMGLFGFGWIIDIFRIPLGKFEDSEGRVLR